MRGVYFLANDAVFELAVAFTASVREHNPDLPLCLIPFDAECVRLRSLCRERGIAVYADEEVLRRCDAIAAALHGGVRGHYRKLAAWEGPFDEFICIDVDTVVLASLDFAFGCLLSFDIVTSHGHLDGIRRWVWKRSIGATGLLTPEQIAFSANTGFIASRRRALSIGAAEAGLPLARRLRDHMVLLCHEQPFLNLLIVTSRQRFTTLLTIARAFEGSGTPLCVPTEYWAGTRGLRVVNDELRPARWQRPPLLLHWAGQWQPTWWDRIAELGSAFKAGAPAERRTVRRSLRYAALWHRYRYPSPDPSADPHRRRSAGGATLPARVLRFLIRGKVASGPFRGMRYGSASHGSEYLPKLLGTYEKELSEPLAGRLTGGCDCLVNVGAGEGYYAVGAARMRDDLRVVAFERDERGRRCLTEMADLNACRSRIEIRGTCSEDDLDAALSGQSCPLVVVDVEGEERTLLDPRRVPRLKRATILVEVHDFVDRRIGELLVARFRPTHRVVEIRERARTLADQPLAPLRWLARLGLHRAIVSLMDEGRPERMRWLLLEPLPDQAATG